MSYFTQMVGLATHNFFSAAAGMARFALSETEVPRSVMTCLS